MLNKRLSKGEINQVFRDLRIQNNKPSNNEVYEVWEVPPIRRGTRIYTTSHSFK